MKDFYFVYNSSTDPYFNMAFEEYFLKHKKEYYVCIWRNEPAVIVGVNQNTISEVNTAYTEQNGIKVVRRLTGGDAVYHDLNNVCYTVIAPYCREEQTFKVWSLPVVNYLKTLGVNAEFSGRNDLTVNGKKISGAAETVFNNRLMHHGTLLFDIDKNELLNALKENKLKILDKGIKSVKSRVVNIKELLSCPITITEFIQGLNNYFKKDLKEYFLTQEDLDEINRLKKEKYSTFDWNVGNSPKAVNSNTEKFPFGIITVNFNTIKGKISSVKFTGDFFSYNGIEGIEKALEGVSYTYKDLLSALDKIGEYIKGATAEEIANLFIR